MFIARVLLISLIGLAGCITTTSDDSASQSSQATTSQATTSQATTSQATTSQAIDDDVVAPACIASFCTSILQCPACAGHTNACTNGLCVYSTTGGGGGGGGGGSTCPHSFCTMDSQCVCATGRGVCVGEICQF